MLYDMRMYVYICLYIKLHTQRQACVADMSVMHIYRYIMKEKTHLMTIFSESIDGLCSPHMLLLLFIHSTQAVD